MIMKRKGKRFAFTISLVTCLSVHPSGVWADAVTTYRIGLSGNWWRSFYTFIVVDVTSDGLISPRYVEHDNAFGTFKSARAKWFDFPATAVRACPKGSGSWGNNEGCITSEGKSLRLHPNADKNNFRFDFKYSQNGATHEKSFEFDQLKPD
jgi:hypothetical protein